MPDADALGPSRSSREQTRAPGLKPSLGHCTSDGTNAQPGLGAPLCTTCAGAAGTGSCRRPGTQRLDVSPGAGRGRSGTGATSSVEP